VFGSNEFRGVKYNFLSGEDEGEIVSVLDKESRGGIAPLIRNLCTKWRWIVFFTPGLPYPRIETLRYRLNKMFCGRRSRFNAFEKVKQSLAAAGKPTTIRLLSSPLYWLSGPGFEALMLTDVFVNGIYVVSMADPLYALWTKYFSAFAVG
jgi:hypothetical protein